MVLTRPFPFSVNRLAPFLNGGEAAANKYAKADLFKQLEGLVRPFL